MLLASASSDHTVRLWDPATGEAVRTLGHTGGVSGVCGVQVGGRMLLASASSDRRVRLWDPATLSLVAEIPVRYPAWTLTEINGLLIIGLSNGLLALALHPTIADHTRKLL